MRIPIALSILLATSTAHATEPTAPSATTTSVAAERSNDVSTTAPSTPVAPPVPNSPAAANASSPAAVATPPTSNPAGTSTRTHRTDRTASPSSRDHSSQATSRRTRRAVTPPRPPSASLGYANLGRLVNPSRLEEDDTLRYVPGRPLHYGTDELIGLIHRAARTVYRHHHTRLSVGDLSASGGGPVGHHASHQSGRDADISFYVVDARGEPVAMNDYLSFRGTGVPFVGGALRFDTARNWALVEAMLTDPSVTVEHMFVSNPLRSLLIHYARTHGVDSSVIARAEATLHQPIRGNPHTNHFHVRIGCPSGDVSCVEGVHRVLRRRRHPHAVAGNTTTTRGRGRR